MKIEVRHALQDLSTAWIENHIGVRQGCVMSPSPTLFNLYLEELMVRIGKIGKGVKIGEERLGCLVYGDDLVLMAENKQEMEQILYIGNMYGNKWALRFSQRKHEVMEFSSEGRNQQV